MITKTITNLDDTVTFDHKRNRENPKTKQLAESAQFESQGRFYDLRGNLVKHLNSHAPISRYKQVK